MTWRNQTNRSIWSILLEIFRHVTNYFDILCTWCHSRVGSTGYPIPRYRVLNSRLRKLRLLLWVILVENFCHVLNYVYVLCSWCLSRVELNGYQVARCRVLNMGWRKLRMLLALFVVRDVTESEKYVRMGHFPGDFPSRPELCRRFMYMVSQQSRVEWLSKPLI